MYEMSGAAARTGSFTIKESLKYYKTRNQEY